MSVKFRIGLTIDGETLFGLMAKMLPIENLSVEELAPQSRVEPPQIAPTKWKTRRPLKHKRASPGPNLKKGLNGIIVTELKEKPLRSVELQTKAVAAGFSANSITSRLESLLKFGVVERIGDGKWRLK